VPGFLLTKRCFIMSIRGHYKTNPSAEVSGVPFPLKRAVNADGTIPTFHCARMGGANKRWSEAYREVWAPFREMQEADKVPEDVTARNSAMAFVRGCLRGWDNVQNDDGSDIEFNETNAVDLFIELPELLGDLQSLVIEREAFLKAQTEAAAKN
jgi:hypothetical protein